MVKKKLRQPIFDPRVDPDADIELLRLRLAYSKSALIEYQTGAHGFGNQVEMTKDLIEITRKDIAHFEALIATLEARHG